MTSAVRLRVAAAVGPVLALAAIAVLDLARAARDWPVPVVGLLDEPAHLLTAWIVLAAVTPRTTALRTLPWVLAGAVLIDLDHVPLYLGLDVTADGGGRPVTHSLVVPAVFLVLAGVRRWRPPLLGLAAGVALHLLRDLATGPGVSLFWPVEAGHVRLPYSAYVVLLAGLALLGGARRAQRPSRRRSRGRLKRGHSHSAQSLPAR